MNKIDPAPGNRIKELRAITRLSRRAFSEKHGIPKGTLQNCEEGRYQKLTKKTALKIVDAFRKEGLECHLEWLTGKKNEEKSSFKNYDDYILEQSDLLKQAIENARIYHESLKFFDAAASGRLHEIENFIENGINVHLMEGSDIKSFEIDCNTPLHLAALNGYHEIVRFLIRKKSNVNSVNRKHQTPLHLAVYNGHTKIIDCLIAHNAHTDIKDNEGDTSLAWAAYRGQLAAVLKLLDTGASVFTQNDSGNSPLHWSAEKGHTKITHLLIEKGADMYFRNKQNKTPLDLAIARGQIETVKYLLSLTLEEKK